MQLVAYATTIFRIILYFCIYERICYHLNAYAEDVMENRDEFDITNLTTKELAINIPTALYCREKLVSRYV